MRDHHNMCQSRFLLLALEVILAISVCDELDLDDLKNMRLTCTFLAEALAPLVLHHIKISAKRASTLSKIISELQYLSRANSAIVLCIRQVTILFWLPSGSVIPFSDEGGRLRTAFLEALIPLRAVESVTWYPTYGDAPWFRVTIWDAILSLGHNLRHLTVSGRVLDGFLDNIESLTKLESINFQGVPGMFAFAAVSKVHSSSSTLESIRIQTTAADPPYLSLHQLFSCATNISSAPRLRHLDLANCVISLDEVTLPHLINLTSLKISTIYPIPNLDAIWMALKVSGIHLEELILGRNTTAESLVDYLSSFSGLKKLRMSLVCSAAARFWTAAFPNHIDTLEDFALNADELSRWCLFLEDSSVIVQCRRLKSIKLSVLGGSEDSPMPEQKILQHVKAVIDMAVTDMPYLEHLDLQVVDIGGVTTKWYNIEGRIGKWIPTYEPPSSCRYLPQLSVEGGLFPRLFVGIRNRDMKLVYEKADNKMDRLMKLRYHSG